jgi:hypothetical protein
VFQTTLGSPVTVVNGTLYWLSWFAATENFDFEGDPAATYWETDTDRDHSNPFGGPPDPVPRTRSCGARARPASPSSALSTRSRL